MNLLGGSKSKDKPVDDEESSAGDGKNAAAKALMSALKGNDAGAVVEAFETLSSLCSYGSDDEMDD